MPRRVFTYEQLIQIRTLLNIGYSFWAVKKELKKEGLSISDAYLSKLKNAEIDQIPTGRRQEKQPRKLRKLSSANFAKLKKLISVTNLPTQRDLAKRFHCSRHFIQYAIKRAGKKLVEKPKCHALTAKTIEKRMKRSRPLYRRLCNERWRRYVTSDEAWVYMTNTGGQRSVQYVSRNKKRTDAEPAIHIANPEGVMVWVAISADGVSRPLFIEPGAKINAKYYQDKVLAPFFDKDRLWKTGLTFHHDSAPAHKARTTLQWLDDRNIRYITPGEWTPSSPDLALCDFFLWGYLKSQLNKRTPRSIDGLKKAIASELQKIPQEMVNRALRAWPKRCLQVYRARGRHIERFR